MSHKFTAKLAVFVVAAQLVSPGHAEEGLWTPDHFPSGAVRARYGVTIDHAWLDHVTRSAVRLSNRCSASLVSPDGLVLTNNHCVSECAQAISEAGHDDYTNGFVADDRRREKRCSNMAAETLLSSKDVTQQIIGSGRNLTGQALLKAHADASRAIERSNCPADSEVRCQVSEFYRGGQYKLFKYREYSDVRLVFSAGAAASLFGGNEFPPYAFDVAFLRVYDKDQPAKTPDHFRWNSRRPREGEPVFVAGSPRVSERGLTLSQLQTDRDMSLPYELVQAAELIGRLTRFGEESEANRAASHFQLFDLKNHYAYILDLQLALSNQSLFQSKAADEAALRAKAGTSVAEQLSAVDQAERARREQALSHQYLAIGPSSELFRYARMLVRGAVERSKSPSEQSPTYSGEQSLTQERELFRDQAVYGPLEQLELEFWLDAASQYLDTDTGTLSRLLGKESPAELSTRLSQSKLGDVAVRRRLWGGGLAAIQASNDPMIRYVLQLEPAAQASDAKWAETVVGPETRAAGLLAQARLRAYGTEGYPDANATLRISYGSISGYTNDGKVTKAFTTFGDLYEHATGHAPYVLDPRWVAGKPKLDLATALNISTTNDGINGNSGSPLLDARGEVIGAFFGGNTYAMGGNFGYDPQRNRAVAVSAEAITSALVNVYSAPSLVRELSGAEGK